MPLKSYGTDFKAWFVPLLYAAGALLLGFTVPRLAYNLSPGHVSTVSVNAAIGFYSAIASGMIALTGIVFSLTFVMVQFFQAYSWSAYFSLSASSCLSASSSAWACCRSTAC